MMTSRLEAGPCTMWLVTLVVLACLCAPGAEQTARAAQAETPQGDGGPDAAEVWAAGDGAGVFLLAREPVGQAQGFRIYWRELAADRFWPGPAYSGEPDALALHRERLLVYLATGGVHSYDLRGPVYTERRVPADLRVLACTSQGAKVYALVEAQESAELELLVGPGGGSASAQGDNQGDDDANTPVDLGQDAVEATTDVGKHIKLEAGESLVIGRHGTGPWYSLTEQSLGDVDLERPCMSAFDGGVHLFGVKDVGTGRLGHYEIADGQFVPHPGVDIDDVVRAYCLTVNRQVRVVLAMHAPTQQGQPTSDDKTLCVFRVGWRSAKGWRFSEPLHQEGDQIFLAGADQVAFAPLGQNLAVFHALGPQETAFGITSLAGTLIQPITHRIEPLADPASGLFMWFFSPYAGTVLLIATFGIFVWRRDEAYLPAAQLPQHVEIAPLPRRLAAFILDTIPASLLARALFPDVMEHVPKEHTLWEQARIGYVDPSVYRFMAVSLGLLLLYFTACELLLSATPGKMITRLQVVDYEGKRLRPWQALLRNLLRFELNPASFFVLFVVLFTVKRQRLGDLAARTLVVYKNPERQAAQGGVADDAKEDDGPSERGGGFDEHG